MNLADSKGFRRGVCPAVLLFFTGFWLVLDPRILGLVCLLVIAALSIALRWRRNTTPLFFAWGCFIVCSLIPVDITFIGAPGPPHFVPLIIGLPKPATIEHAKRGEVVLHGCISTGFEPGWVLVW